MSFITNYSKEDFNRLIDFLNKNNLKNHLENPIFKNEVRLIHKNVYSFLLFKDALNIKDEYLEECVSDFVSILPLIIQNFTKPSRLLHRSALENISRALVNKYSTNKEIVHSKRVSEIFTESKSVFSDEELPIKLGWLNNIYSDYSYLCNFSHTSEKDNFTFIDTLTSLNQVNMATIINVRKYIENSIQNINNILFYVYIINEKKSLKDISPFKRDDLIKLIPDELLFMNS